jgi:nucleoside-diphosphate-sugar epimerase
MTGPKLGGPVLVTGAGGFIGRRLVGALAREGAEVTGWTRPDVDLLDRAAVAAAMDALRPATVFHLASAGVGAARAHDPRVIAEDVAMMDALLAAAPRGSRLVVTGSMAEYGRGGRHGEEDRCDPRTAYAIARLAAGSLAQAYAESYGLALTVARLYGVYGPGEASQRLFPQLIESLSAGHPVALSDGLQRRDFIHVDDVCRALIAIAAAPAADCPAIVNVGTGRAVKMRDAAEWVADALSAPRALLRFGARQRSPGDEDLLEADVTRLSALLGAPPPQRLGPRMAIELFTQGAVDPVERGS